MPETVEILLSNEQYERILSKTCPGMSVTDVLEKEFADAIIQCLYENKERF